MQSHVPEALSARDLATILPISERRIRQLENKGILSRDEAGLYPVAKSLQAYVAYREKLIEEQAATPRVSEALQQVRRDKIAAELEREDQKLIELTEALEFADMLVGKLTEFVFAIPGMVGRTDDERATIAAKIEDDTKRIVKDFAAIRYQLATGRDPE